MIDSISRPDKMTDSSTILYEIDMFRFAAHRLFERRLEYDKDVWTHLEAFLLHYRNLIEFLGKQGNISDSDLHVTNIWTRLSHTEPDDCEEIKARGRHLWEKYERGDERISR